MTVKLEDIIAQVEGQSHPPVDRWNPDFCGDIDMRIDRNGRWYYMGTPIGRERLVRLFSTILRRDMDGKYYLVTPVEKVGIQVEDVPFMAVRVDRIGTGAQSALHFATNVGDEILADADHPVRVAEDPVTGEPRPYILVRGRLEARIARPPFYERVEMAEERLIDGKPSLAVYSREQWFALGAALTDAAADIPV